MSDKKETAMALQCQDGQSENLGSVHEKNVSAGGAEQALKLPRKMTSKKGICLQCLIDARGGFISTWSIADRAKCSCARNLVDDVRDLGGKIVKRFYTDSFGDRRYEYALENWNEFSKLLSLRRNQND